MSILDLSHIAISSAGFRDGLGERLLGFDRSGGATLELLRVRPELAAFESALAERVERLAEFTDRRFVTLRGVGRDPATGRPLIVSEHVEGERLSEVLERAAARTLVPDITVALHIVVHALQALAALERACKTAHGALGLDRVLVLPRGRLLVADHALAPILARLGFSHGFLWRELRLAMPAKPVPARFNARADIAQAAVMLIACTIGRPLLDDEYPGRLAALASEVREIARIRGGDDMADGVGDWLDVALPTSRRPSGFGDAAEARFELERALPKEPGIIGSRQDLQAFLDQIAAPDSGVIPLVEAAPASEQEAEPPAAAPIEVPTAAAQEYEAPLCTAPEAPPADFVSDASEQEVAIDLAAELPWEPEAGTLTPEAGGLTPEAGGPEPEAGGWRPEAGPVPSEAAPTTAPVEPVHEEIAAAPSPVDVAAPPAGPTLTFDDEAVAEAAASFAEAFDEAVTIGEQEVWLKPDLVDATEIEPASTQAPAPPILEVAGGAGPVRLQANREEDGPMTEVRLKPYATEEPPVPSFDFAVPPPGPPAPPAPPAPEPALEAASPIESAPEAAPRQRLISDADLSLLPDWMVKPDAASNAPPPPPSTPASVPTPPSSPAPRPGPPRSIWPDTDEAPVRGGTLFGFAGAEAPEPREEAAEEEATTRARRTAEAALEKHRAVSPPVEVLALEPEAEGEADVALARPRVRQFLAIAAVVLIVAAAAAIGVRWLNTRAQPGTVVIESTPAGSDVLIDGQPSGTTPATLELSPGQHTLELRRRNRTRTFTLTVAPGAEITQSLDWETIVDTGALRVTSEPDGARVSVDGQPRGQTPLDLTALAVGRHTVVVATDAGSVANHVRITVNETTALHVPVYSGWLAVFSPVELQILERGRLIGTSSGERLMAPPGRHELELVNEDLGYRSTEVLDVRPGETASLSIEPKGQVNLNAIPWAEVFIDGEKLGETPMANVPVTIGTREFLFRHPEFGERRVTAVVTMKETTHVNVDLTKQ